MHNKVGRNLFSLLITDLTYTVSKLDGVTHLPLGDAKVSFVDVRDIAPVAVESLTNDRHYGKAYMITGPEALSCHEVAQTLSTATGKNNKVCEHIR